MQLIAGDESSCMLIQLACGRSRFEHSVHYTKLQNTLFGKCSASQCTAFKTAGYSPAACKLTDEPVLRPLPVQMRICQQWQWLMNKPVSWHQCDKCSMRDAASNSTRSLQTLGLQEQRSWNAMNTPDVMHAA